MNQKTAIPLLLLLVACFNLFWNISPQVMEPFDEGRHVASAVEMLRSHNFLINTYMGAPDYWNAKPPLTFWATALGLVLSPDPFLGVRLFSLLAALATTLLAYAYAARIAGRGAGLLAAALFITAPAIILHHCARTADPDMLFVMLIAGAFFAFASERRAGFAAGYFLLGLSFLAKSFHAAPYSLTVFLFMAWRWRRREISLADLLLPPFFFLLPVLPWAAARYLSDGTLFFQNMLFNDVLRRSTQVIENHKAPVYDYVVFLLREFGLAIVAAAVGLRLAARTGVFQDRRLLLAAAWLLLPLCIYSIAKSRMEWYTYSLFVPGAVLLAVMIIKGWPLLNGGQRKAVVALLAVSLLFNESFIAVRVLKRDRPSEDPVLAALRLNGVQRPGVTRPVYLESVPVLADLQQDYYATALLIPGICLHAGGATAYAQDKDGILITRDGKVLEHGR